VTLDDQRSDQCGQGVLKERPSHATDLAQCCKIRYDGVDDLGLHGDVGVDVDTMIPGCSDWRHQGITDTNRTSRDDAYQRTSVFAQFSCSRFAFIHAETSSMQTCCIRLPASGG